MALSIVGRWRTFLGLSPNRRRLFLQAWALLPMVWVALRVRGFHYVHATIDRVSPRSYRPAADPTADAVEATHLAARYSPIPVNCLLRSLVLVFLLRRRGLEAELRFGVRRQDGRFEAHAWVERCGEVLNDDPDVTRHYRPFREPIPATQTWR